jgi:hypothetical protein
MKILILISALFLISLVANIFLFYYQLMLHIKCNRLSKMLIGLESGLLSHFYDISKED